MLSKIQFITPQPTDSNYFYDLIHDSLEQGIDWIQYRNKLIDQPALNIKIATKVFNLCKLYNATFIVNDDVRLAQHLNADGIHLGKTDWPIDKAKEYFGTEKIYGASSNKPVDIVNAIQAGFTYTGLGPFRKSTTKLNTAEELGLSSIKAIFNNIDSHFPIYVIGGLELNDILQLKLVGVKYFALSSTIVNLVKLKNINLLLEAVNS